MSLEHIEFNTFNILGIFKNRNNRPFAIFIVHPALSIATTSMTTDNKHMCLKLVLNTKSHVAVFYRNIPVIFQYYFTVIYPYHTVILP